MPLTRVAQSRRLRLPSIDAHFVDWDGDDPPVVLLHPNRTNARVWDHVVEHSRLRNRFIAPDARGHGLSSYPERGYGYEHYLDDLSDLFAALSLGPLHLVGAATGGNLALLWASQHPEAVLTVTVVDPGLSLDPAISRAVREQMVREFSFPSLAEARARMPFSRHWAEEMREHYSRHSFEQMPDGQVRWRYHPPGVVETEHLLETPIWDRIDIRCPMLAVRGKASAVFTADRMAELCKRVPDARSAEIDADHRVSQDNPAGLAALVDEFVGAQR